MQDVLSALRNVRILKGIDDEHLKRLAEISRSLSFPAHREIFHQDDPGKDVYFIVSGEVSLITCTPRVGCRQLMKVEPGELIGWSPLLGTGNLTDTARTLTPTELIAANGDKILEQCALEPRFGFEFMHRAAQTLASRLSATRMQLLDMGGVRLPEVQFESD